MLDMTPNLYRTAVGFMKTYVLIVSGDKQSLAGNIPRGHFMYTCNLHLQEVQSSRGLTLTKP